METKIAIVDTEVKNLGRRFEDFLNDVRALRGTWTTVTIALVALIFSLAGFTMSGFNNVSDTQMSLVKEQVEIKSEMKEIKTQLIRFNESMETVIRDHKELTHK
jgi:hypothetical protein